MALQLNNAQKDAVESEENILCCACPGSGKTRVLINKVSHVLSTHPDPRIILTTFSRDAANEIRERITKDLSEGKFKDTCKERLAHLTIGTFHALALKQLKEVGRIGKILSEIETRHLIRRSLHETRLEVSMEEAEAGICRCKSDPEFAGENPDLDKLTAAYKRYQAAANASDFTDILLQANGMMEAGTLKPLPATHLFADEYQDVDIIQFDWLLHHLRQNPVACAVGDDDQSIFGFRRSLGYKGMMEFAAATGARPITLDTNYRSTDGIVSSASRLISNNVDRVRKNIKAARGAGPLPKVIVLGKNGDQAMKIVHALDGLCAKNPMPVLLPNQEPSRFAVRHRQAAVLARTNAQLHAIEDTFREARVPFLRTGRSFWDAPVLQVYQAILQSLLKKDGIGLEIALRWARVQESRIGELAMNSGGSIWSLIDPTQPPQSLGGTFGAEAEDLLCLGHGWADKLHSGDNARTAQGVIYGVAAWMTRVMTGSCASNEDGNAIKGKNRRDVRDMEKLEAAKDTLADGGGNLQQRLFRLQQRNEKDIPRVILSTFHSSKGLEWEHVFLVDVYGGSVPKCGQDSLDEELEEERRVFYVAMTRARDSLTIFTRSDQPPCEFLAEAGLEVVAQEGFDTEVSSTEAECAT